MPAANRFDWLPDELARRLLGFVISSPHGSTDDDPFDELLGPLISQDWASGQAARLVCRRWARLLDDELWATWTITKVEERTERRFDLLEADRLRYEKIKLLRIAMVHDERSRIRARLLKTVRTSLAEAPDLSQLVQLDISFTKVSMPPHKPPPMLPLLADWLVKRTPGSLPSLRTLQVVIRTDEGSAATPFPVTALTSLLAAACGLAKLKLEQLDLESPDGVVAVMPKSPLPLRDLSARAIGLRDEVGEPLTDYLEMCFSQIERLQLSDLRSFPDTAHTTARLFSAACRSPRLQTASAEYNQEERAFEVDELGQLRQDLRFLTASNNDPNFVCHLVFAHRLDATTLAPRTDAAFSWNVYTPKASFASVEILRHLEAGNAPELRCLDLRMTEGSMTEPSEHVDALEAYCRERSIEVIGGSTPLQDVRLGGLGAC